MKRIFLLLAMLFASSAFANFTIPGKGTVTYPTGVTKSFEFGFAWDSGQQQFTIGKKSYNVSQLPEAYSLAMALSPDERTIWLQEFAKGYFSEFTWQLGEHTVSLKKRDFAKPVKGDYVLSVNDMDYFFIRNSASITVKFDKDGVRSIAVDGVTKDMGTKQ